MSKYLKILNEELTKLKEGTDFDDVSPSVKKLIREIISLSDGTLAGLTGLSNSSEVQSFVNAWVEFVAEKQSKAKDWKASFKEFTGSTKIDSKKAKKLSEGVEDTQDEELVEEVEVITEMNRKKALKVFGDDPYYVDVINAKSAEEVKKATKALTSVRGRNALEQLKKVLKEEEEQEEVTESDSTRYVKLVSKLKSECQLTEDEKNDLDFLLTMFDDSTKDYVTEAELKNGKLILNKTEFDFMKTVAGVIKRKLGRNPTKKELDELTGPAMLHVQKEFKKLTSSPSFVSDVYDAIKNKVEESIELDTIDSLEELVEGKSDYKIYHLQYSDAVTEILNFIKKNGYEHSEDDVFNSITSGPRRPKDGVTNRITLDLYKNEKLQRKKLHAQVYGMGKKFELNMYIS